MNSIPAIYERTLRCANAALYVLMAVCVVTSAAWAWGAGRLHEPWQMLLAAGGSAVALLWALHYVFFRYTVGPDGITLRRMMHRTRTHAWSDLLAAEATHTDERGVVSCCITLKFAEGVWRISSDHFSPDDVQDIAALLAEAGLLTLPPRNAQ